VAGFALAVALLPLMTVVLAHVRGQLAFADDLLIYLLAVLAVTCVGGLWPAVATAVAAGLCLNYYFTPPIHRWTIDSPQNLAALLLFVAAAVAFSAVVHVAARESAASRRAVAESQDLVDLAQTVLREDDADAVLRHLARTRGVHATLEELVDGSWVRVAGEALAAPTGADVVDVRSDLRLRAAAGGTGRLLIEGAAAQAAAALDRSRLRMRAAEVEALAQSDRMRAAILAAVSHDLRTPLAAVKAGVSSLRQTDVTWSPADRDELVLTIEEGADRLEHIVNNLLDMSRVETGTVAPLLRPMAVDEVLPLALTGLDPSRLRVEVPDDLPLVLADPGLLERVVANLVDNALKYSPADGVVTITADRGEGRVALAVVDHGPGVPLDAQDEMFVPFRQMGDRRQSGGVGLGLAVVRGFAEAMGSEVAATSTPGGGLTMTVRLPVASNVPVRT
jgi:two-component system sensor histidine kinase KdpD